MIRQYNWTVGCNWTVEAANHTKFSQLNPPMTELITITIIATTTYPKQNFKIFFALDIVPTGAVCPRCTFFFSEIVMVMINW